MSIRIVIADDHPILRSSLQALFDTELSISDVAAHLHLSETTVKSHLAHIYPKLGVSFRTAAVAAARRSGLLRSLKVGRGPVAINRPRARRNAATPRRPC